MTDPGSAASVSWLSFLDAFSVEHNLVLRIISWFFLILALIPASLLFALIAGDVVLWIWRHCAAAFRPSTATASSNGSTGDGDGDTKGRIGKQQHQD